MTDKEIEDWRNMKPQNIYLSQEDYNRFVEILNSPPAPTQGLIDLLSGKGAFDEGNSDITIEPNEKIGN